MTILSGDIFAWNKNYKYVFKIFKYAQYKVGLGRLPKFTFSICILQPNENIPIKKSFLNEILKCYFFRGGIQSQTEISDWKPVLLWGEDTRTVIPDTTTTTTGWKHQVPGKNGESYLCSASSGLLFVRGVEVLCLAQFIIISKDTVSRYKKEKKIQAAQY